LKKTTRMLKKVVIGVMVYWVGFVVMMIITFFIKGTVPDTLIQYALGGGVVELVITALIELVKPVVEKRISDEEAAEEEQEDEDLLLLDWEDLENGCSDETN